MTATGENARSKHEPTPHPESVNRRLARYLDQQRRVITKDWMQRAGNDKAIPAETLICTELQVHLVRFFDDLIATLRYSDDEALAPLAREYVADHTTDLWSQNYTLPEVLREIAHLRTSFLYRLRQFEELNPDFGTSARLFASTTIHRLLDDLGIRAAEQFLETHGINPLVEVPASPHASAQCG